MSYPPRFHLSTLATSALLSLVCLAGWPAVASAQQTMRTGDGALEIRTELPQEVRVGEQFTYQVEVRNVSENMVLHEIKLRQTKAQGFSIESTSLQGDQQQSDGQDRDGDQEQASQTVEQDGSGQQQNEMQIAQLQPGQSRTIEIKASADREGDLQSCLEVVSYRPAICLTSQVVKPDLKITKMAPDQVDRCSVIELEYSISNDGSGDLGKFQVVDELADGLMTIEGNKSLKFDVDGLKAGETRSFVGRVFATEPGEFASRAVARAENADLKSRSENTKTKVVAAELDVRVEGPGRLYGEQLAKFTAFVTNVGNAPAEDVRVKVRYPRKANLADLGDYQLQSAQQQDSGQGSQQGKSDGQQQSQNRNQAQANNGGNSSQQQGANDPSGSDQNSQRSGSDQQNQDSDRQANQSQSDQQQSGQNQGSGKRDQQGQKQDQQSDAADQQQGLQDFELAAETFQIGQLKPNQTAKFQYAIRPGNLSTVPTQVEARYVCTIDMAQQTDQARARSISKGMARAELVRLPALQIVAVDDEDPVSHGEEVQYTIRVWNEGDAADQQIEITAELPDGLEFVAANGPTEHSVEGKTVTFKPMEKMKPEQQADYRVTARSTGSGDVRFRAKLNSEALDSEVVAAEPTRLFNRQARRQ